MDKNRLAKQALQYNSKVATNCTVDGHVQNTQQAEQYKPKLTKIYLEDGYNQVNKTSHTI